VSVSDPMNSAKVFFLPKFK